MLDVITWRCWWTVN